MLHQLDQTFEAFLRAEVPLPKADVDIVYDAPDNEWRAGVTKPTLNLFLWDIRMSADEANSGRRHELRGDKMVFTEPDPRIAFRYLLTAWTTEVSDEHRLLGSVLTTLLPHRVIGEEYLVGALVEERPLPTLKAARSDSKDFADFWSAIEGKLKPGLDIQITATVAGAQARPSGPPTEEVTYKLGDKFEEPRVSEHRIVAGEVSDPAAVGAAVWSPRGATVVDGDGRFSVSAFPGDEIIIETKKRKKVKVGDSGSIRVD